MGNLFDGIVNEVRRAEAERNRKSASKFNAGRRQLLDAYNRHGEMITKVVQDFQTAAFPGCVVRCPSPKDAEQGSPVEWHIHRIVQSYGQRAVCFRLALCPCCDALGKIVVGVRTSFEGSWSSLTFLSEFPLIFAIGAFYGEYKERQSI